MSATQVTTFQALSARPPFMQEQIASPRDINLNVSATPKAASTTAHPFYDSVRGKWFLPAGRVMGKITSSGLYIPCKRTRLVSGGGAGATTAVVADAASFKVGDTISSSGGTGTGVILSINYTTKEITSTAVWGGTGLGAALSEIFDNTTYPGAETAVGLLTDEIDYTPSFNQAAAVFEWAKIVEAALSETITAAAKVSMPHLQFI